MNKKIGQPIFRNGNSFLIFAGEKNGNEMVYIRRGEDTKGPVPLISALARSEWNPIPDLNQWVL
jgi:hypothetical protein